MQEMGGKAVYSICRLCLGEKLHLLDVFESKGLPEWTVADAIVELLRIQVSTGDIYPKCVCVECMRKLEEFKLFKQQCERNKDLLDRAYAGNHGVRANKGVTGSRSRRYDNQCEIYFEREDVDILIGKDPLEADDAENPIKLENEDCYVDANEISSSGVIESDNEVSILMKNECEDKEVNNISRNTSAPSDDIPKKEVIDLIAEEESDGFFEGRLSMVSGDGLATSTANNSTRRRNRRNGRSFSPKSVLEDHSPGQRGTTNVAALPSTESNEDTTENFTESNSNPLIAGVMGLSCNVCMERFSQIEDMEVHMSYHGEEKTYTCVICDKRFHLGDSLKRHKCGAKFKSPNSPFVCNWCDKQFSSVSKRNKHVVVHSGARPFHCNQCGKSYTRKRDLKAHLLFHFGDRPHKCTVCGKSFIYESFLKTHMVIHSGEKPFQCEECGKAFTQSGSHKRHVRLHTGHRPFKCDECGKTFSRRVYLKEHLMRHSGIRPFKCCHCSMAFVTKNCLDKHLNVHSASKLCC